MQDLLFVALVVAFFAVAVGAVNLCDRIVHSDEPIDSHVESAPPEESVA